jgi:tRNA threonylcarbamoyladenosine biosynthesis protein TsaE
MLLTPRNIRSFAKQLAGQLKGGEVLALIGPLGAGKTAFVKALGQALGIRQNITSPSFILLQRFAFRRKPGHKTLYLYHLDLYRTKKFAELAALGLYEFLGHANIITAIEWADKIKKHLPKNTRYLYFVGREPKRANLVANR